jgi:hypothetical protein
MVEPYPPRTQEEDGSNGWWASQGGKTHTDDVGPSTMRYTEATQQGWQGYPGTYGEPHSGNANRKWFPNIVVAGWPLEDSVPIEGTYTQGKGNHGLPSFHKGIHGGDQAAVVYFWDDRDGDEQAGWWFSPEIGSEIVWAYHPGDGGWGPPKRGWFAPPRGGVSKHFHIEHEPQHNEWDPTVYLGMDSSWPREATAKGVVVAPPTRINSPGAGTVNESSEESNRKRKNPPTEEEDDSSGDDESRRQANSRYARAAKRKGHQEVEEDESESEDGHLQRQRQIKCRHAGIARVFGAMAPFAEEDDPIYKMTKSTAPPPWPVLVSSKGKLFEMPYGGEGVKLNFLIPGKPMKKLHREDFYRVTKFICHQFDLSIEKYTKTEDGTAQISFGTKKGTGTVQLYLTARSAAAGNCLVQIGEKEYERVQKIRDTLLRSVWFTDTPDKRMKLSEKVAETAYKGEGKILLPILDAETEEKDFKKTIEVVRTVIGIVGKKAMQEYATRSELGYDHKIHTVIENTFKE